jgi:glutamine amidotransferase
MAKDVGIVDYGVGNLRSIYNALSHLGSSPHLVRRPEDLSVFDRLILPGVGAFQAAMASLKNIGMDSALDQYVTSGHPVLGICLGMQLMCNESAEGGIHKGLGWMDATVRPFKRDVDYRVPHIGWNSVHQTKDTHILNSFIQGSDVYFVHSYYVHCNDESDVILSCEYGVRFVAGFSRNNIFGLQFHPEKSQVVGLNMISNFLTY